MTEKPNNLAKDPLWYKDAIIYELHIKAFCDGTGDGTGDFKGIISKLDYLQALGITAIWVLPFYPSPLKDDGYDIADYYTVNPIYGDNDDFKLFLAEAHRRGLKVITELVINHTSDQHPWFQRARRAAKGSPEREFYVWTDNPHQYREVRIIFQDYETSNWTWDPMAQQYYWHRFFHHQPDLNYDSPLVQQEIFKIIDHWCGMGVDGFRLDAVPYLFEREGSNCENLPETHAFLKKLRHHVDAHYPGTLLLAEANMWPEDSASYFGTGDECHMNYHFPAMPRMFMSVQMEDRYPITDIFDQTPAIPANCQWAIFLRNHDELTLEMVTDEERDYMYKTYTKDPRGRINLGIRHRLAPLLDNNRRKIELLNSLLFSLPGTPVLYYGDEIGMGDNFYLGDRDGVRTPMQWSADRNAGFSKAASYRLYLPVITDPAFHYENVNVETQARDAGSLLNWMRSLIALRKDHKVFGRGDMRLLDTGNSRILAFLRSFENEVVLVAANLSRYVQPVELELQGFEDLQPVELHGGSKFPFIKKDQPYFLNLAPYECRWLRLEAQAIKGSNTGTGNLYELDTWEELTARSFMPVLAQRILEPYFKSMRWFGGKARSISSIRITDEAELRLKESPVKLCILEVAYHEGLPDLYQLCLAFTSEKQGPKDPKAALCRLKLAGTEGVLYDALYSREFQQQILEMMAHQATIPFSSGELLFRGSSFLQECYDRALNVEPKVLSAEQSNSSVIYGDKLFLKIYRKVDQVLNPDLELTQFLTEAGYKNIPAFAGAIYLEAEGNRRLALGMMQKLVENEGNAWTWMLAKISTIYKEELHQPHNGISAEHAEEHQEVLHAITLLATRTAEMHLALASDEIRPEFRPEEFSLHYQRSLYSGFQSLVREAMQNLTKNLDQLNNKLKQEAERLMELRGQILQAFRRIYSHKLDAARIRVHGDYHLGQVLVTGDDFVILDFEGEPARSYSERRIKRTPLKDVAGMLRSFHYAAYAAIILADHFTEEERVKLYPLAEAWYKQVFEAFVSSYVATMKGSPVLPSDPADFRMLLESYLLEKAIYELNYELNNRPDWALIPLRGIASVMNTHIEPVKDDHHA